MAAQLTQANPAAVVRACAVGGVGFGSECVQGRGGLEGGRLVLSLMRLGVLVGNKVK